MTYDTWHVILDTWSMTYVVEWTVSKNYSCLALTVRELWCFEDREEKDDWLTELISYKGVCRTAPATPGLLKKSFDKISSNILFQKEEEKDGRCNNDPPCSADTERLPTRNPRKDYLTQTFISSPILCLLCSHCSIPDDLLFFAHEQVSFCVIRLGSAVRLAVKLNGTATPVCRLHE